MTYTHYYAQQSGFGFGMCVFRDLRNCMVNKISDDGVLSPSRDVSRSEAATILRSWKKSGIKIRKKKVRSGI